MKYNHHKITNFPKDASLFQKIKGNVFFFFAITKIWPRRNFLRKRDFHKSMKKLQPADLVLVGTHQRVSSFIIRGIVTHSLLYIGEKKLIHSVADGVEIMKYKDLFKIYDTLIVLRPRHITEEMSKKTIEFALQQLNKPYNYNFQVDEHGDTFFCTELINNSYKQAGVKTGLENSDPTTIIPSPLRPTEFINNNFEIIFTSKSLVREDNKIKLNKKYYKNEILEFILER